MDAIQALAEIDSALMQLNAPRNLHAHLIKCIQIVDTALKEKQNSASGDSA